MNRMMAFFFVALIMGSAWFIRGTFGFSWGASWAGVIGGLAVLAAANRRDWNKRLPVVVSMCGIGWGFGGIMSYGLVLGYCNNLDFLNVYYGFCMLVIIGGLFGFAGGGFLGLTLESGIDKRVKWPSLLTEMTAFAMIGYGVLIFILKWYMTPPRTELWAACLGASASLFWYMKRNNFHRSLKVAAYSALGAGFGFAFGCCLQTVLKIPLFHISWLGVTEFSLGFWGGLGMAVGVLSSEWPRQERLELNQSTCNMGLLFFAAVIPLLVLTNAMELKAVCECLVNSQFSSPEAVGTMLILGAYLVYVVFLMAIYFMEKTRSINKLEYNAFACLYLFAALFLLFGNLKKGFYLVKMDKNQIVHWPVLLLTLVIYFVILRIPDVKLFRDNGTINRNFILKSVLFLIVILAIFAFIAIRVHSSFGGYSDAPFRFGF